MNILTIDTSTELEIIGLQHNNKIYKICRNVHQSHSSTIFANIQKLLLDSQSTIENIELIGAGIGPGSFTGIRIAVTTARMLAQVLKIPLTGFETHKLFAFSAKDHTFDSIIIAFDAKKTRVFGAVYQKKGDDIVEIIPPGDYDIELLGQKAEGNILSIGNGIKRYEERLNSICSHRYLENFEPDPAVAVKLTIENYNRDKKSAEDINNTVPLYTRKSDAETALEKKNKSTVPFSNGV